MKALIAALALATAFTYNTAGIGEDAPTLKHHEENVICKTKNGNQLFKIERLSPKKMTSAEKFLFDDDKVSLTLYLEIGEGG